MYHKLFNRRNGVGTALGIGLAALLGAASTASAQTACQNEIGKTAQFFEDKKMNFLAKCEDKDLKGLLPANVDCPDTTTTGKINDKEAAADKKVGNKCGGDTVAGANFDGLVSICVGGDSDGALCASDADCSPQGDPGVCTPADFCPNFESGKTAVRTCNGGSNNGEFCGAAIDCAAAGAGVCRGGANNGLACTSAMEATDCPDGTCDTNLCEPGCGFPLANTGDIGDCVQCVGEVAVDQLVALSYGSLNGSSGVKAVEKCKQTLGKEAAKFFRKARKRLLLNQAGEITAAGGDAEKFQSKAAKACGGVDKAFGGGDDQSISVLGAPLSCPAVTIPSDATACGGFITTTEELFDCLECVSRFKAECSNELATNPASYPAQCNPTCGNGKIDAGEDCDDGNLIEGDACPADCRIEACTPSGETAFALISFTQPAGADISSLTIFADYPDGVLSIPGSGGSTDDSRFSGVFGATIAPNDRDHGLQLTSVSPLALSPGGFVLVTMDVCQEAIDNFLPAPTGADFTCRVLDATGDGGDVVGVDCSVTVVGITGGF